MINTRQKGRELVKEVIAILKDENGIECYETVGSGSGTRDKGDIRVPALDLVIEAKKHKRVSMTDWAKQSEKEGLGYNKTALAWQIPQTSDIRIDIDVRYFANLLKRAEEPKMKQPDREMKYELMRLVETAKRIIKRLE